MKTEKKVEQYLMINQEMQAQNRRSSPNQCPSQGDCELAGLTLAITDSQRAAQDARLRGLDERHEATMKSAGGD